MSPTEFSNYIKQRAMQQQIHHHHHHQHHPQGGIAPSQTSPGGRSLSPLSGGHQTNDPSAYFFQPGPYHPQFPHRNMFDSTPNNQYMPEMYSNNSKFPSSYLEPSIGQQFYAGINGSPVGVNTPSNNANNGQQDSKLLDGLNNFSLGGVGSYPANQYQHLLVAN